MNENTWSVTMTARSSIASLVCGYPSAVRRKRNLLMLTVFCDDSGSNYKTPFCVVAGYVATAEQWMEFSDEWAQLLGRSKLKYLKMSEARSLNGQFLGWCAKERDAQLIRFAEAIYRHLNQGVGSFVSNESYKYHVKGQLPRTVDHPYFLCRLGMVNAIIAGAEEKVDFVFDRQGEGYERRVAQMHAALTENVLGLGDRIGTLSFANSRDVVPLQAADMLCSAYADSASVGEIDMPEHWRMLRDTLTWNARPSSAPPSPHPATPGTEAVPGQAPPPPNTGAAGPIGREP